MPSKKPSRKKVLTPKQKKLVGLLPKVAAGDMNQAEAMERAGYSKSTARQQSKVMTAVRQSSVMQEALRKAGVTEERLAGVIDKGIRKNDGYRYHYVKLGAELLDAFPAKKNLHGIVDPEELLNQAEKETVVAPWGDAAPDD